MSKHILQKLDYLLLKKAISDFKRFDPSPELVAELLIFLVEQISDYAKLYGVTDISFYDSIESNYLTALVFINDNDLLDKFKSRAKKIVDISYDEYFNSLLCDIYLGFYLKIE